jgi:hypothetical protein
VLNNSLSQAFDQYVFDRVDTILGLAAVTDENYRKAVREVDAALEKLLRIAKQLEPQQPELTRLVRDFESAAASESGCAAEFAYKQGMRDLCGIRQEFSSFLQGARQ